MICKTFLRLFITIMLLSPQILFAQKEAWNWYFGDYAAINFSSGAPSVLNNSAMTNLHGVASISDANGDLLFYTNGMFVYDKTHLPMLNGYGLLGDANSTQSALILKMPGSSSFYYIFTIDDGAGSNGLNYSIVDMTLNGGNGDVTLKNVPVRANAREKLTAIKHANGSDYWIVIIDWASDFLYSYQLNNTGLDTVPVVSVATGLQMQQSGNGGNNRADGYMKANRQGNRIAMALWSADSYDLFDFNNSTGIASNHIKIQGTDFTMYRTYGIEFSPDGTKLYGSAGPINSQTSVYQFNLNAGTPLQIYNSRVLIGGTAGASQHVQTALQIAPDGKIYCSDNTFSFLTVIDSPDSLATGFFMSMGPSLGAKHCLYGLPNFPADYAFPIPVAVAEIENKIDLKIYPNPATNEINVQYSMFKVGDHIILHDMIGNSILTQPIASTDFKIETTTLKNGVYFLQLNIGGTSVNRKIIINN